MMLRFLSSSTGFCIRCCSPKGEAIRTNETLAKLEKGNKSFLWKNAPSYN